MLTLAIMGNGPVNHMPDLKQYEDEVDIWIGADRGALILVENNITISHAVGDFDSINVEQRNEIMDKASHFSAYPSEKDATDLEIAIKKAIEMKPEKIYLFGVTGGRMDHTLINIQLLHTIVKHQIRGVIVDQWNHIELTKPGIYKVHKSEQYPYVSFVPFSKYVRNLSLTGFYYPLKDYDISWGSTRCISNKLTSEFGSFSYKEGSLLLIKSCDDPNG